MRKCERVAVARSKAGPVLTPLAAASSASRRRRGRSSSQDVLTAAVFSPAMAVSAATNGSSTMTPSVDGGSGKAHDSGNPEYLAFVLVPVFFLLGLLGVLICHILKQKGYRCTTDAEDDEDECVADEKDAECAAELNDTFSDSNSDTVGQIVHFIMKNEANSDALKAMVHDNSVDSEGPTTPNSPTSPTTPFSPTPPITPVSPGAPAGAAKHTCSHLHTIGGVGGHKNICNRCSQKKWPLMRQGSRARGADRRSHPGEVTVLSVGRFRVTKCDPKPAKERRTLIITEANGSVPSSPVEREPRSRTGSEREEKKESAK